jgi:hypothetical protein
LQLPIGVPIDLPIVELYDIEQVAQIVNEQVTMVFQATKAKAKGGKKRNKVANKATLKPLEDPIIFVPPSPIDLPHMGQPPHVPHVGTHAQYHPYDALPLLSHDRRSTFDMKTILVHFIKMLDDANWEKCIFSPPLKELCFFLPR